MFIVVLLTPSRQCGVSPTIIMDWIVCMLCSVVDIYWGLNIPLARLGPQSYPMTTHHSHTRHHQEYFPFCKNQTKQKTHKKVSPWFVAGQKCVHLFSVCFESSVATSFTTYLFFSIWFFWSDLLSIYGRRT
jgi:hypothetical protein